MAKQAMTSSLMPLYLQVVANIKYAIDSGAYKVGDKIPTETELGEQYGVSRITVRRAVSELVDAGYLTKQQGRGTFVKSARDLMMVQHRTDLKVQSFSEACRKSGYAPGSIQTESLVREATAEERTFFGLAVGGQVISFDRVCLANGIPVMIETNVFPRKGFEFLEQTDLSDISLYRLLEEKTGKVPHMVGECRIGSMRADAKLAAVLEVPAGEPLFVFTAGYGDQDDKPLYTGAQRVVGARYTFAF